MQECREVTRSRESESGDHRVFGTIRELIETTHLEWSTGGEQSNGLRVCVFPTGRGDRFRRVGIAIAHSETCLGLIQRHRRICKCAGHGHAVIYNELLECRTDNGRAIWIPGDRYCDC